MHKFLKIAFLCIFTLALASCSEDEPNNTEPQTAEKTIFVFMPYSDNLYTDFIHNIEGMETAIEQNGGLSNTRLLVFIARDKQNAALINIKYDKGKCQQDTLERFQSPTYLTIEGRVDLLNKVKRYAPADNYAMIIGCHGKGWIPKATSIRKKSRYFGGLSADYQINIDDFATSIMAANMKMQFILFDDCYLSCIEVACELKDATDYIIASTSEIMQYGMPYQLIYKHLMSREPDYNAVCSDFYKFYSESDTPYGTIGVTDCKYVDEMIETMKSINATHSFDENLIDNIQDLDGKTYSPTIFFDFDDYVRNLCINDDAAYKQFQSVMQRLVPYKAATRYIWSGSRKRSTEVTHFSGMTISDPSLNSEAINTKKYTNWWVQTH